MTTTKQNLEVKLNSEVDFQSYQTFAREEVEDIISREGKKWKFLNWIGFLNNKQVNIKYKIDKKGKIYAKTLYFFNALKYNMLTNSQGEIFCG